MSRTLPAEALAAIEHDRMHADGTRTASVRFEMPDAGTSLARRAGLTAEAIEVHWDVVSQESWTAESVERCWNAPLLVQARMGEALSVGLRLHEVSGREGARMRRQELFSLAAELGQTPSRDALVDFVVNVNAWGYGSAGYAVARTRDVVAHHGNGFNESARRALEILRMEGAAPAYYFLNNRSAGHVYRWGPAFFTKFLYFADPRNQPGGPGRSPDLGPDHGRAGAPSRRGPREPRRARQVSDRRLDDRGVRLLPAADAPCRRRSAGAAPC